MTSWFEGMPIALLEAMTAGVPVLSTPWMGARDMLADGRFGMIAPSFEPARVAAEIERAMSHPTLRRELADRAQRHVTDTYDMVEDGRPPSGSLPRTLREGIMSPTGRRLIVVTSRYPFGTQETYLNTELAELTSTSSASPWCPCGRATAPRGTTCRTGSRCCRGRS